MIYNLKDNDELWNIANFHPEFNYCKNIVS